MGKDADIVIYDPEKDFTIHQSNMHSDADHTIWEGSPSTATSADLRPGHAGV